MPLTKEDLQERAQLVRMYESACHQPFPNETDTNFRVAIMKRLAISFGFRELRDLTITGPALPQRPPSPPKK